MKSMIKYILVLIIMLWAVSDYAQDVNVPIDQQVPIFAKIFQFDRHLTSINKSKLNICIIYQSRNRKSLNSKNKFTESFNNSGIKIIAGKTVELRAIDFTSAEDIVTENKKNKIDILVIPQLQSSELLAISEYCKNLKIISFTLIPEYFKQYSFGITLDNLGDRPQININLKAVKKEGADFSSQLLKLSKINEQ